MRGSKTPPKQVVKFRAHYLQTRNVAESARVSGVPERTAFNLAKEADKDPDFAAACRELHARAFAEVELLMLEGIRIAMQEVRRGAPQPVEHANGVAFPPDMRPQFLREVVNAHKTLTNARRLDAERHGDVTAERDITIRFEAFQKPNV